MSINGMIVHDWEDYEAVVELSQQMELSEVDVV